MSGRVGRMEGVRTYIVNRKLRRRCSCGCGQAAQWVGLGDGVALISGCEWLIRLWMRDPWQALRLTLLKGNTERPRGSE